MCAKIHGREERQVEANTRCSRVAHTMMLQWKLPNHSFLFFKALRVIYTTLAGFV